MKLELNRGQIIAEGLSLAGRPDLVSNARLWFSLFLEEFYYNQDFEWLVKNVSLAITDGMSQPDDYRAAKSAKITSATGATQVITIKDAEEYDAKRSDDMADGLPTEMYIDSKERKFYFLPGPTAGLTLELKYFYIPEIPDHTLAAEDLEVPVWELPKTILVDFIKSMAMEYNDDSRQDNAKQYVMQKIAGAKFNARDHRAGSSKMKMGKSFKKRF